MMEYVVVALILLVVLIVGGRRAGRAPDAPARASRPLGAPARDARAPGRARTGRPAGRGADRAADRAHRRCRSRSPAAPVSRRRSRPPAGWSGCAPGCRRSQNVFGRGLLGLLSRDHLDEDAWEEIEDSLITADVGVERHPEIVERLRERTRVLGTRTAAELRALLAEELVDRARPDAGPRRCTPRRTTGARR